MIAKWLKILAFIVLGVGLIAAILAGSILGLGFSFATFLSTLLNYIVYAALVYGAGEVIDQLMLLNAHMTHGSHRPFNPFSGMHANRPNGYYAPHQGPGAPQAPQQPPVGGPTTPPVNQDGEIH